MKVSFTIKDDWIRGDYRLIPHDVIKKEWKRQIGSLTADGDLILEIVEVSAVEFNVIMEVQSEKTTRMFGGMGNPLSVEML